MIRHRKGKIILLVYDLFLERKKIVLLFHGLPLEKKNCSVAA